METAQLKELVLQSLAHERGGVKVYKTALKCAADERLKEEWGKYFEQTQRHVTILEQVCSSMEIDADEQTPGTEVVTGLGAALVRAMQDALACGNRDAAQLVACECVVLAETKDHLDWQLIEACGKAAKGVIGEALRDAAAAVEDEEDEHLYHTAGWCRELWLKSLGLKAVLPPPEEKKHVTSAIGAARAEQAAHPK
jgi:hypothetical protein